MTTPVSSSLFGAPWTSTAPGARSKQVVVNGRTVRLLEVTHEFHEAELCRKAHDGLVLEGALTLELEGREPVRLSAGDALVLRGPEDAHRVVVDVGQQALLLLFEHSLAP